MTFLIRLVPVLLIAPIMVYFFFYLRRMVRFWLPLPWKRGYALVLTAICIGIGCLAINAFGSAIVVVMHLFLVCVVVDGIHLVVRGHLKGGWWPKVYQSGVVPLAITILILTYAYWNMQHVVQQNYTIQTEKEIRPEGYRIAFLSDLHFGMSMQPEDLQRYAEQIEAEQPDLVLLGGDIVDDQTTLEEMQLAFQILGSIQSTYGTYYVYGNHDRARYNRQMDYTTDQLDAAIQAGGVHTLSDESLSITDDLVLVGREDSSFSGTRQRAPSAQLLTAVDPADFILLLDHQPRDLAVNQENGFDLQLSGHTHAGQIWPIGLIGTLFHINEMNYGYRQIEDFQIIVSSGMAGWGYPLRTSGHSEYVMIQIEKTA